MARPVLQSVVPLGAVPERLRHGVAKAVAPWGYAWSDVTFAGTALTPPSEHSRLGPVSDEVWVFAVTVGTLQIGDELESAGSRAAGISLSAFAGGVIPVTPFQARVYEYLGGGGGGPPPQPPSPAGVPTNPDTQRAVPDRRG
ncbi:MAG TPA: hypothetical protein VG228_08130 [Solirubrobacteraceae bacterium]|jgi:hypothetical protein|nr:hypothetical protein [Solirubrobacteraceae bacterium]